MQGLNAYVVYPLGSDRNEQDLVSDEFHNNKGPWSHDVIDGKAIF